jgi:hypothetical protein
MGISRKGLVLCLMLVGTMGGASAQMAQQRAGQVMPAQAEQLFALANEARGAAGAGPLKWDGTLAAAARQHCLRMAAEGPIAHRYGGEPDLSERAGQAGAHFSLIEENVAVGPTPPVIHDEWMHSAGHRSNLLNPAVDRVGVAVVASRGELYAVADYAQGVAVLTQTQVEGRIARLMRGSGVSIVGDSVDARAACTTNRGLPSSPGGLRARFVMRWQDADLTRLPQALADRLASGQYRQAAVGSCPAQGVEGQFTAYRVAVLLY